MNVTLGEVDAKLAVLQRGIRAAQGAPGVESPPSTGDQAPPADEVPSLPAPVAPPSAPGEAFREEDRGGVTLAQLLGWRERLRGGLVELAACQSQIDGRIALASAASGATPDQASTPAALAPSPAPVAADDVIFEGTVSIDAGPLREIAALEMLQRALAQIPGARYVHVTSFGLQRAHIELDLDAPVALGRELRMVAPSNFAITGAAHGHLMITLDG